MEIRFQPANLWMRDWEPFLNRVWECDPSIVMVYSPRVGTVILELDPAELRPECRDQIHIREWDEQPALGEEHLLQTVRDLIAQSRKRSRPPDPVNQLCPPNTVKGRFELDQARCKELIICLDTGISTYLHYYLPLCVILADEQYRGWFYSHFSQICLRVNATGYVQLDFLENSRLFAAVLHNTALGFETIGELGAPIIQLLIDRIKQGDYLLLHLDEACLPNKHASRYQYHYVQQSLIYGYDLAAERFAAIGFDQNNRLNRLYYSFAEVENAFQAAAQYYPQTAPWAAYKAVQLIRLHARRPQTECFDLPLFRAQLDDYLSSKGSIDQVHHYIAGETVSYGVAVYQGLRPYIQKLAAGENLFDYRVFHLLAEHKKGLGERLRYLTALTPDFKEQGARLELEYEEVVNGFDMIRLNVLKRSLRERAVLRDIYRLSNHAGFVQELLGDLNRFAELEQEILNRVCRSLFRVR